MLKLIQFYPVWDLPNASPFCMKLETYLRMANIPYENQYTFNPKSSPTRKFPAINDDGQIIADSGIIIDYLKQKHGDTLDQHLSFEQKGIARAIQRMLEEHAYWIIVYSRWIDPKGWAILKSAFFGKMPILLKMFIPNALRKKVNAQLDGTGITRHSQDVIYELGKTDVKAIADILGQKDFIFGDQPTSIDACVYAYLANILYTPIQNAVTDFAKEFETLDGYCQRMKARYYA